jgi:aminopeptidase
MSWARRCPGIWRWCARWSHGKEPFCVADETDRAVLNESAVHTDFMVGGPEIEIDGQERAGAWIPILRNNEFQIARP